MTLTPFTRALLAAAYIALLAVTASNLPRIENEVHPMFGIVGFLSVFVFSAALMGYLFLLAPVLLVTEGKSKEAVRFFVQTLVSFAAIAAVMLGALFLLFST
jgi:hypothetical protein